MRTAAVIALLAFLMLLGGCSKRAGSTASAPSRPHVVVSIFPLYDLARRVAGEDADVSLLLPPGHNEHHFDPTPKDIERASRARLGVMVGLGLDSWMTKLLKDSAPTARVLQVGQHVPTLAIRENPIGDREVEAARPTAHEQTGDDEHEAHGKGATDPHVWLDPTRARTIVATIADELVQIDPSHAAGYRERAANVDGSLAALDAEVEKRTKTWKTRGFVTFHGSFQYFANRYGLDVIAVIEPYPGSQPSGEYVARVLDVIRTRNVPALFSEPQLDPRPAKILADEAKLPLGVLDPVGGGKETDDYEKTIRFDVAQLEKYLQ